MAARYSRSSSFPFRSEKEKYLKGVYDDDDDRSSRLQNCRRVESVVRLHFLLQAKTID